MDTQKDKVIYASSLLNPNLSVSMSIKNDVYLASQSVEHFNQQQFQYAPASINIKSLISNGTYHKTNTLPTVHH